MNATRSLPLTGRLLLMACGAVLVIAALAAFDRAPAVAEKAASPAPAPAAPPKKLDLAYIPASAVAAFVVHPSDLLTREEMQLLPIEVISVAGKKELGIDPLDVEQVVALVGNVTPIAPPDYGVIIRLTKPHSLDEVLPAIKDQTEAAELKAGEKRIASRQSKEPPAPSYAMPDEQTLVIGSHDMLEQMLTDAGGDSPLRKLLAEADVSSDVTFVLAVEPVRELLKAAAAEAPQLPPELAGLLKAPDQLESVEARIDLKGKFRAELSLLAVDEDAAEDLEKSLTDALSLARKQILAEVAPEDLATDPVEKAMVAYTNRITNAWLEDLTPGRDGARLTIDVEAKLSTSTVGVAAALLLPAVQAAREAGRRVQSQNNMHQIMIGMHNYLDARRTFPRQAIYDEAGKPLLSWRVALLPHLGHQALFDQFHLDEPWDSEHNKPLIGQMPPIYQNPNLPRDGKTNYLAPVGEGTLFGAAAEVPFLPDGTSNTIAVVEADADKAVIWTRPDDLDINPQDATAGLGGLRPRGFLVAFFDASTSSLRAPVPSESLWGLFTHSGGETIDRSEFE